MYWKTAKCQRLSSLCQLAAAVRASPRWPPGLARSQMAVWQHSGQGDLQHVGLTAQRVLRRTVVVTVAVETDVSSWGGVAQFYVFLPRSASASPVQAPIRELTHAHLETWRRSVTTCGLWWSPWSPWGRWRDDRLLEGSCYSRALCRQGQGQGKSMTCQICNSLLFIFY